MTNSTTGALAPEPSAVEQLINAGRITAKPIEVPGRAPSLLVPDGFNLVTIPEKALEKLPDHIRQKVELSDAESFVSYVKLYQTGKTRIFAFAPDVSKGFAGAKFTAILDYHVTGSEQAASRCKHVATYPCPLSLEFATWLAMNGRPQTQDAFVLFVEANAPDMMTPPAAEMMELAMNFEMRATVSFGSKIERVNGGRNLIFTEDVEQGRTQGETGKLKVPETLALRIPIFEAGEVYDLTARMEYRATNGKLAITYHLQRPHVAFREALKSLHIDIETGLDVPVLVGAPVVSGYEN